MRKPISHIAREAREKAVSHSKENGHTFDVDLFYELFAAMIEDDVIERIKTVGLINERGEVLTLGTSWRINE